MRRGWPGVCTASPWWPAGLAWTPGPCGRTSARSGGSWGASTGGQASRARRVSASWCRWCRPAGWLGGSPGGGVTAGMRCRRGGAATTPSGRGGGARPRRGGLGSARGGRLRGHVHAPTGPCVRSPGPTIACSGSGGPGRAGATAPGGPGPRRASVAPRARGWLLPPIGPRRQRTTAVARRPVSGSARTHRAEGRSARGPSTAGRRSGGARPARSGPWPSRWAPSTRLQGVRGGPGSPRRGRRGRVPPGCTRWSLREAWGMGGRGGGAPPRGAPSWCRRQTTGR
jgi:hypothetical protein